MKHKWLCSGVLLLCLVAGAREFPDRTVSYKTVGDHVLTLELYNPPGHQPDDRRPGIVFFFGGGWRNGTPEHLSRQSKYLASRGMVAICADYRTRDRHQAIPKQCVQDGRSAMRWVREHSDELGIDPQKIAAGGGSAGGHIAAATAALKTFDEPGEDTSVSCRPDALVLFNPVFDNGPEGYGYDRVKDYWWEFSPMHNLDEAMPPTLVILGTKDKLIPVSTAKTWQKKLQSFGIRCDLKLYPDQPHGFYNHDLHFYADTLRVADQFLTSLGYLSGKPTIVE